MSAWRPCCGDCGFEHLQEAEGHPLYCGRCGAAWDGSEVMEYRAGCWRPSSEYYALLDLELRGEKHEKHLTRRAEYREWIELVVSG